MLDVKDRTSTLTHRPDNNPVPALKDVVDQALNGSGQAVDTLGTIATNQGAFGRKYLPELIRAFFEYQDGARETLNPKEPSLLIAQHLDLVQSALTPIALQEMHLAEKIGWVKLMNFHLNYLSFVENCDDNCTDHLQAATAILNTILFEDDTNLVLPDQKASDIINVVSRHIRDRADTLINFLDQQGSIDCLRALLELAGNFKSPTLYDELEATYWKLNNYLASQSPEDYGAEAIQLDLEEDDEFEEEEGDDDCSSDNSENNTERLERDRGTIVDSFEDLSFEDQQAEENFAQLEQIESIHDFLVEDILNIAGVSDIPSFAISVLENTSVYISSHRTALEVLAAKYPEQLKTYLPILTARTKNDQIAVAVLLDLMALTEVRECNGDIKKIVTEEIKKLPPSDIVQIIEYAEELIRDGCELILYSDLAAEQLAYLKKHLN